MQRRRPRRVLVGLCAFGAVVYLGLGGLGEHGGRGLPASSVERAGIRRSAPAPLSRAAGVPGPEAARPAPEGAAPAARGGPAGLAAQGGAGAPSRESRQGRAEPGVPGGWGVGPARAQGAAPLAGSAPARTAPRVHVVQPGETIWDIAQKYGVDVQSIRTANQLGSGDLIRVGQQLTILPVQGIIHRVEEGESLWDISRRYGVGIDDLVQVNGLEDPDRLQVRQEILIPGVTRPALPQEEEPLVVNGRLRRAFSWPARGPVSSRFGRRWGRLHEGIDIALSVGTPVRAAAPGIVSYAGWGGGYGYLVIVDHGYGVETRYAHNSRILVQVGQRVERGEVIARSGNTGRSTGPHLHFEIRHYREAVDPLRYLR